MSEEKIGVIVLGCVGLPLAHLLGTLQSWEELTDLDGVILAVAHKPYRAMAPAELVSSLRIGGALIDVKSMLDPASVRSDLHYWSL